jgi:hypothetical protein
MSLESIKKQFLYYKSLGEKAMAQLKEEQLFIQLNEDSNSVATIVKHLSGNMLSRWTDFLSSDGEKEWRNRDAEFENDFTTREQVITAWSKGWECLMNALNALSDDDLQKVIYIRNEGHTVMEAIARQLCHYPYHVGQIVFLAKALKETHWDTLSIAKNKSNAYNSKKFSEEKGNRHFTDGV